MASIQAHQDFLTMLKRDVQAAWIKACEVDGIDPLSKFVVLSNSTEAAAYNEMMGMYLKARRAYQRQIERNKARRDRHAAFTVCGLKRVTASDGRVIYE